MRKQPATTSSTSLVSNIICRDRSKVQGVHPENATQPARLMPALVGCDI
jgi:hypothetical protein